MKGWRYTSWGCARRYGEIRTVRPLGDSRRHRTYPTVTMLCWCEPDLELVNGGRSLLVTHFADDARELVEAHGIN